jgi:hypothetical protein
MTFATSASLVRACAPRPSPRRDLGHSVLPHQRAKAHPPCAGRPCPSKSIPVVPRWFPARIGKNCRTNSGTENHDYSPGCWWFVGTIAPRIRDEPSRLDRERGVPAARRAGQYFDHEGRQDAPPRIRRHRQGGGEGRRCRLVRRCRPHCARRSAHRQQLRGLARDRRLEPYQHHRHRERRPRRPDRDGADRPGHPPAQSGLRSVSGPVQVADAAGHDLRVPGAVAQLRLLAEPAVHRHRAWQRWQALPRVRQWGHP